MMDPKKRPIMAPPQYIAAYLAAMAGVNPPRPARLNKEQSWQPYQLQHLHKKIFQGT